MNEEKIKVVIEIPKYTKAFTVTTISNSNRYDIYEMKMETKSYTAEDIKVLDKVNGE